MPPETFAARAFIALAVASVSICELRASDAGSIAVNVEVNAARPVGVMKPIWRFFGADEPNYATMKDGRKLLGELGELRTDGVFFRSHNLLCTGDGTPAYKWGSTNAYTEDKDGNPVYDWTVLDRIFDTYRSRGIRPYAQIGFMPEALSVHPQPYQHAWRPGLDYKEIITGWAYPPKDYAKWAELVRQWVLHCVARYGQAEVEKWYWEVWNEPNLSYWQGTPEQFYRLHDLAVDAVRRALPTARVGGPDVAGSGGSFMEGFLAHCARGTNYATGQKGTPTDFLSFHAKGQPSFVDGHVRLGIAAQLSDIRKGFRIIASVPELRGKPIVIGESDPDGCAACLGPQLGYRTGTMYSSYTAASFAREFALADQEGVDLEGALTWAFEFEDQPYFSGQRVLATNGIDLPVLNVFRMFSKMSGSRLETHSSGEVALEEIVSNGVRGAADIGALASLDGDRLCVLLWHYHDDDVPGPAARVKLAVNGLPSAWTSSRLTHFRIDGSHSNAAATWRELGSPVAPNSAQYGRMLEAGQLAALDVHTPSLPIVAGSAGLDIDLPRQAVSLIVIDRR